MPFKKTQIIKTNYKLYLQKTKRSLKQSKNIYIKNKENQKKKKIETKTKSKQNFFLWPKAATATIKCSFFVCSDHLVIYYII